ncbi:hypothetical protein [Archangium lipolyticum]|uniref:hypothetical protein n=1 Tax=Archangium lipolyticum TaxID=2970465 RepID=UPI00214A7DF1|nr:hypothetical protein [Archangium lipolyticum]
MKLLLSLSAVLALALSTTGCGKTCSAEESTTCSNKHTSCITACGDGSNANFATCVNACNTQLCDCQTACGNTCDQDSIN